MKKVNGLLKVVAPPPFHISLFMMQMNLYPCGLVYFMN
jgi:hypothetical protein